MRRASGIIITPNAEVISGGGVSGVIVRATSEVKIINAEARR